MARNVQTVSFSLPSDIVRRIEKMSAIFQISKSSYVTFLLSSALPSENVLDMSKEMANNG